MIGLNDLTAAASVIWIRHEIEFLIVQCYQRVYFHRCWSFKIVGIQNKVCVLQDLKIVGKPVTLCSITKAFLHLRDIVA